MSIFSRSAWMMSGALTLTACGDVVPPPRTTAAPPPPVRYAPNAYKGVSSGPAELVGRNAAALTALLGRPNLDVREGSGRKLQFLNDRCVLDTYLYPPKAGSEAIVTYVEARDRLGIDMAAATCAALLHSR